MIGRSEASSRALATERFEEEGLRATGISADALKSKCCANMPARSSISQESMTATDPS